MVPDEVIVRVLELGRLRAAGREVSIREIGRVCGISRGTVKSILEGRRRVGQRKKSSTPASWRYVQRPRVRRRCPECGARALVTLCGSCRACALRRVWVPRPADLRALFEAALVGPLGLDLRPPEAARYREVVAARRANAGLVVTEGGALAREDLLGLKKAARLVARRFGRKCSPATIATWARDGICGATLETTRLDGRRFTSREALSRFFKALRTKRGPPAAVVQIATSGDPP